MRKYRKSKLSDMSLRTKLILIIVFASVIIFVLNLFMYSRVNMAIGEIDKVYVSNVSLNELSDTIKTTHGSMYEYLTTTNQDALEDYFRSEQKFSDMIGQLHDRPTDNEMLLLEKNIRAMSETYLNKMDDILQAKRGRNIEKYRTGFEEAGQLYDYINQYIYTLNNMQFKINSDNYEVLLVSQRYLEMISSGILVAVMAVDLLIIAAWTQNIVRPLGQLAKTANAVAAGNFDADHIEVYSADEIGVVTKAFNKMLESIREYIRRLKDSMEKERVMMENEQLMKEKELMMETHLKDAQLRYLQSQINPHFLFNSLNAGAQLAMMEGAEKSCLFIEKMADYFRYNVKKVHEDSTLEEEVQTVENYIYILNVRFSGEIHFDKRIDRRTLQTKVPSMILQPIVENSVKHGITEIDWDKKIWLSIQKKGDLIRISIRDNGKGISPEKIAEIMEGSVVPSDSSTDSTGIGLGNVIARFRLYYGRDDTFLIRSDGPGKGTEVVLTIPFAEQVPAQSDERRAENV